MTLRRALVITAVSALALGLAACDGGSDEPSPTVTTATTAASSTEPESISATPTEPAVEAPDPAAYPGMDEQTEEGAKQAYKFFWDAYVYAMLTGDPALIEGMSGPDCEWCASVSAKSRSQGAAWASGQLHPGEIAAIESDGSMQVAYKFNLSARAIEGTQINNATAIEDTPLGAASYMSWRTSAWRVDSVDVNEQ